MKREACKFFSGAFAALAYAHAAYAVATARGIISEPIFLGRRWGVGYMWTEAAVYSAAALALGYLGWHAESEEHQSIPVASAGIQGVRREPAAAEQSQPVPS